jgi:hypothetical protein
MANRPDYFARIVAISSLFVSGAAAAFAYRNAEASRRQAELRALEVEQRLKVFAYRDPADSQALKVRLSNEGSPTTITTVGFYLNLPPERPEVASPSKFSLRETLTFPGANTRAGLPRRLEHNDGLIVSIRAADYKDLTADVAGAVYAVFAETSSGTWVVCDDPAVAEYFSAIAAQRR